MINKHLSRIAGLASFNTRSVTAALAVSAALLSGFVADADAGQLNVNVSARGNQRSTWQDADAYDRKARELARMFRDNFEKFADSTGPDVTAAGPLI